eukprot:15176588-Alexandrium_andersonii.AAC.1
MRRARKRAKASKRQGLPGRPILAPAVWSELWNFFAPGVLNPPPAPPETPATRAQEERGERSGEGGRAKM